MASSASTMKSVVSELTDLFTSALHSAFPSVSSLTASIHPCAQAKFGHYQFNSAMSAFQMMKGLDSAPKNPRAVSEAVVEKLGSVKMISKTEIAGPGFVNIYLEENYIVERLERYLEKDFPTLEQSKKMKCVVDFSSPNIAKEMHVGHLRSTIIGDTISRLLEYVGHNVLRVNHVGDWGTQFGMLIAHLKEMHPDFLVSKPNIGDLQSFYRSSKKRFDEEPDFKSRAHKEVVQLQAGNEENLAAWKLFCDVSRSEFQKIYDRLDVALVEKGESFYNPFMPKMVDELIASGLVIENDGAKCLFMPNKKLPLMMRKTDGGFTYDTTDMAALRYRVDVENADWIVYVTDARQAGHFDLLFTAAKLAGYVTNQRLDHVPFGMVLGEDGGPIKTRSGDTVRLVDLLDEAKERCKKELVERKCEFPEDEIENISSVLGYGSVKYFDLNKNRTTDYKFEYDRMLDMKGNTAVYLLYTFTRIASIIRSSSVPIEDLVLKNKMNLAHSSEKLLAVHMLRFPDIVEATLESLCPNKLTEYLYDLCGLYSDFYRDCRMIDIVNAIYNLDVLGNEHESSRLLLCKCVASLMKQIFKLLGIQTVERL